MAVPTPNLAGLVASGFFPSSTIVLSWPEHIFPEKKKKTLFILIEPDITCKDILHVAKLARFLQWSFA